MLSTAADRAKIGCVPTEEDIALAGDAAAWAEGLSDETIGANDYLHNLRAVARAGLVSFRTAGIAASSVTAYQRHLGDERRRAEEAARPRLDAYLGDVGTRVSFGLPVQVGKRGKPLKGAPVVLRAEPLTLDFVAGYETSFGYTTILKFRTDDGALVVWKASGHNSITRGDVGKRYTLEGRVKAHEEYRGEKQTMVERCSAVEVDAAQAMAFKHEA